MADEVKAFWENRAEAYRDWAYKYYQNPGSSRYPQAEVRQERVLEILNDVAPGKMLDAGCGIGDFMLTCTNLGWDCYGFDFAKNMVELAKNFLGEHNINPDHVSVGDVSDLSAYDNGEFDLIASLGAFGYVPEDKEAKAFTEFRRVLKDDGMVIVTNVNALLDMFTFNRFTLNFFDEHFVSKFFSGEEAATVMNQIGALVTNPDKPDRNGKWATVRDQKFVKQEVPLAYGEKVKKWGFDEIKQVFYHLHSAPPLVFEEHPEWEKASIQFERRYSEHWIANFLATGFISVLKKNRSLID